MKSIYLIILISILNQNFIKAQITSFGIELSSQVVIEPTNHFYFSTGGHIYYDVNHKIQLSTGIQLQKDRHLIVNDKILFGCNFYSNLNSKFTFERNALFIGIPLQGRLKLIGQENHFYTSIAPSIWLKLSSSESGQVNACDDEPFFVDVPHLYKKIAFSLNSGFGYEFLLAKKIKGYTEFRFNYSVMRDESSPIDFNLFFVEKIRRFQVGLGITFGVRFL